MTGQTMGQFQPDVGHCGAVIYPVVVLTGTGTTGQTTEPVGLAAVRAVG